MPPSIKRFIFKKFKAYQVKKHELTYLFWECTTRCNLNCLHCGSDCFKDSSNPDMPLDKFLSAISTIKKPSRDFIVVLTGGEPLLRNDLECCGREIRKLGMRWGIVSNGYLYDEEKHNSLLNAGMGALTLSLDGLEDSHNWLRNKTNSFERVDRAIELAAGSSRLNYDIVTCVNGKNFLELQAVYDYLLNKEVKAWRLFTIIPIGRAETNQELFLSSQQYKALLDFIQAKRQEKRMEVNYSCEGYVGDYEFKVRNGYFFCRAGINIGSILIDGSISACPNIDSSFIQGNISTDNFFHVWENEFKPFRDRSWSRKGKCAGCKEYKHCQGNGLHNWHGNKDSVLVCHNDNLIETDQN